ncbi:unnamed protein product [Echinostoma caproni]|uniref:Peptidase A1 domain-containing protein n=1 Tax=Echinostoma caproni TaxID=27848 RepID=A0A183A9V6_9TREM|nr:unnamed protein product [Echinostoma caproni]
MISRRLQTAVTNTYYAADLRIIYTSKPFPSLQMKDKLPVEMTSLCTYQFVCSGGTTHIGRIAAAWPNAFENTTPFGLIAD